MVIREYEQAGVREYWIIDPLSRRVDAYALDDEGTYQPIRPQNGALRSTVLEGFTFEPAWLWQEPLPNPIELLRELGAL